MKKSDNNGHWIELFIELKNRFIIPWKHPSFVIYFFVIIIIIGGVGPIEALASYYIFNILPCNELCKSLIPTIYTYFIAIASTAAVEILLSQKKSKALTMFCISSIVAISFCAICAVIFNTFLKNPIKAFVPSVIGLLLSLILWWVGNADNITLLDSSLIPNVTTGGDINSPLSGDLEGIKG